jgi:hypothetical protein
MYHEAYTSLSSKIYNYCTGFCKIDLHAPTEEQALVSLNVLGDGVYCSEVIFVPGAAAAATTNATTEPVRRTRYSIMYSSISCSIRFVYLLQ